MPALSKDTDSFRKKNYMSVGGSLSWLHTLQHSSSLGFPFGIGLLIMGLSIKNSRKYLQAID
jgi:hypothetical protein